ncbi:MAG: sialidase family protein, partial [Gemmatimonadota bacterium]
YTYTTRNIVELEDGSYLMGVGCGHGHDYRFRSRDGGRSWQVDRMTVEGLDSAGYEYSILHEGVFFHSGAGRLLLLARCNPRQLRFTAPVPGVAQADAGLSDLDHYDTEIVFESPDRGRTWRPVNGFPILGCMYPSMCSLGGGRQLFTYTQRIPLPDRRMGVYVLVVEEGGDGQLQAEPDRDVLVIDEKTPDYYDSGGGFGNSLRLRDGSLVTPYSYFDADPEIEVLMRTGAFMERATFEHYRTRALPYFRSWVSHVTWERVKEADRLMQQHAFLGCTSVLNLSGPVTEVCRWQLDEGWLGAGGSG